MQTVKMPSQHRTLECSICKKMMRSNNLKRHWRTKHNMHDMTLSVKVGSRAIIDGESCTSEDLKMEVLSNAKAYNEKIQLGESVNRILMETNTKKGTIGGYQEVIMQEECNIRV